MSKQLPSKQLPSKQLPSKQLPSKQLPSKQLPPNQLPPNQLPNLVVVAGALIQDAALLVAQRARPPELAGLWELPGGKVAPGETDSAALTRELREELGIGVAVGARVGADVALTPTSTLRAYLVTQTDGVLQPNDHRALRWVGIDELDNLPWVPADAAWLPQLATLLR